MFSSVAISLSPHEQQQYAARRQARAGGDWNSSSDNSRNNDNNNGERGRRYVGERRGGRRCALTAVPFVPGTRCVKIKRESDGAVVGELNAEKEQGLEEGEALWVKGDGSGVMKREGEDGGAEEEEEGGRAREKELGGRGPCRSGTRQMRSSWSSARSATTGRPLASRAASRRSAASVPRARRASCVCGRRQMRRL